MANITHSVVLLNIVTSFLAKDIKDIIRLASSLGNKHWRCAVTLFADDAWRRLAATANAFDHHGDATTTTTSDDYGDGACIHRSEVIRSQFIDVCRKPFGTWIVRRLIQGGINCDAGVMAIAVNYGDWTTPLLSASQAGRHETVELLIETGGARVEQCNAAGQNALLLSAQNGHPETVRVLLRHHHHDDAAFIAGKSGKTNKKTHSPLVFAVMMGHVEVVRAFSQFPNALQQQDEKDDLGVSPNDALSRCFSDEARDAIVEIFAQACL